METTILDVRGTSSGFTPHRRASNCTIAFSSTSWQIPVPKTNPWTIPRDTATTVRRSLLSLFHHVRRLERLRSPQHLLHARAGQNRTKTRGLFHPSRAPGSEMQVGRSGKCLSPRAVGDQPTPHSAEKAGRTAIGGGRQSSLARRNLNTRRGALFVLPCRENTNLCSRTSSEAYQSSTVELSHKLRGVEPGGAERPSAVRL